MNEVLETLTFSATMVMQFHVARIECRGYKSDNVHIAKCILSSRTVVNPACNSVHVLYFQIMESVVRM